MAIGGREPFIEMKVQDLVTFKADAPDDGRWSESGDLIVPPGRALVEMIIAGLQRLGTVITGPRQHSYYGWSFHAGRYWCLLQYPGPWLLLAEDRSPVFRKLFKRRDSTRDFQEFLGVLRRTLESEKRISEVRWYVRREYQNAAPR